LDGVERATQVLGIDRPHRPRWADTTVQVYRPTGRPQYAA
jgi:hypothetical protein